MYGLFLRALQGYVTTTFGAAQWSAALMRAGIRAEGFEPLLPYDATLFRKVTRTTGRVLARSTEAMLEDVGTFIVTNPMQPALRRLLRFSGASFPEFLLSLEELPDRVRLALPDIDIPRLTLAECQGGEFRLSWLTEVPELGYVLLGVLRAMADDYGALVLIEVEPAIEPAHDPARDPAARGHAHVTIRLLEAQFAEGRSFDLLPAG